MATSSAAEIKKIGSHNATRSSLGMLVTRFALYPLTILTSIVVARLLGPADRGVYAFVLLFGSSLLPLATLGSGAGVVYLLSSGKFDVNRVFLTTCLLGIATGGVCAGIIFACIAAHVFGSVITALPFSLILPLLLVLPLQGLDFMVNRLAIGTNWFSLMNWSMIAKPLLNAGFLLVAVAVLRSGVHGAVVAVCLAAAISAIGTTALSFQRYRAEFFIDRPYIRQCLSYGIRAWWGDLAIRANLRLDQFLLGLMGQAAQLGLYSVAVNFTELLWVIPDAMGPVLFNRMASSTTTEEDRNHLIALIHRVLFAMTFVVAVLTGLFAPLVLRLTVGHKYVGAAGALQLLLPGTLLMVTTKTLTKYFGGTGKPLKSSIPQVVGAAMSAALYVFLIPRLGIVGAAIASSLGYAATAVVCLYIYTADLKRGLAELFFLRRLDFTWVYQRLSGAIRPMLRRSA